MCSIWKWRKRKRERERSNRVVYMSGDAIGDSLQWGMICPYSIWKPDWRTVHTWGTLHTTGCSGRNHGLHTWSSCDWFTLVRRSALSSFFEGKYFKRAFNFIRCSRRIPHRCAALLLGVETKLCVFIMFCKKKNEKKRQRTFARQCDGGHHWLTPAPV